MGSGLCHSMPAKIFRLRQGWNSDACTQGAEENRWRVFHTCGHGLQAVVRRHKSHQANLQTPKLPFDTHPLITTKAKHTGQLIVFFLLIFKFGDTEGHAGSLFPNQGSNWAPSQVLTTGLPGNSQVILCIWSQKPPEERIYLPCTCLGVLKMGLDSHMSNKRNS